MPSVSQEPDSSADKGKPAVGLMFSVIRAVIIVICILGILIGLFVTVFGANIFGDAVPNDADFRTPIGALFFLAGLPILAIFGLGLLSVIGSGLAKKGGRARKVFHGIGITVLATVLGLSLFIYSSVSPYIERATGEQSGPPAVIHSEGPYVEFYREGPKSSAGYYNANGELHGIRTEWFMEGEKKSECNFVNGKKDGLETEWHAMYARGTSGAGPIRNKKHETHWVNGIKQGPETHWHYSGRKESEQINLDGKLDGVYTEWHAKGEKKRESNYENGKLVGLMTEWYESGQKKRESNLANGESHGLKTLWYETGHKMSEANYTDGQQNGLSTRWGEKGSKKTESFRVDGRLQSKTEWNDIGQIVSELDFGHPDKTNDDFVTRIEWFENGQKKSAVQTLNARRTGVYTHWYDTGQKKAERVATDPPRGERRPGALLTEWYEDGQKKSESTFGLLISETPKTKIMWDAEGNECARGNSDCS